MSLGISEQEFMNVLQSFGLRSFSTLEFIEQLTRKFPSTWRRLVKEHGRGGKGAGQHYSSYSRVSQDLNYFARRGVLDKLDYRKAPKGYGSPIIRYWTLDRNKTGGSLYPDEVAGDVDYDEGAVTKVIVNRYERNQKARQKCVEHYGAKCSACDLNFEARYGPHGAGFIHVHHLKEISKIGANYKVDPKKDLIPLCPNCHAMIHRCSPALSLKTLRSFLAKYGS